MNKSTRLCGNILNINENRITWQVTDITLKGKCPSGRQRTKHKKQILEVFSQKQGRNNTTALARQKQPSFLNDFLTVETYRDGYSEGLRDLVKTTNMEWKRVRIKN
jgi:hypothetical protein